MTFLTLAHQHINTSAHQHIEIIKSTNQQINKTHATERIYAKA
jgi:hypothetical protein